MKINGKHELLGKIARRGLLLAALLAMVLTCAITGGAQSSATTASTQDAKPTTVPAATAQAPVAVAKPATAQAESPALPEGKPAAKGAQEGIKVHGHWTIEVRNPDGSLDKHVEFENAIVSSNLSDMAGGPALLYSLLSGNGSFAKDSAGNTAGWAINLQPPAGSPSPCNYSSIPNTYASPALVNIDQSLFPSCFVTNVPGACVLNAGNQTQDCSLSLAATMGTVATVTTSILGSFNTPSGFTLQGNFSVTSPTGGYLGTVSTIAIISLPQTVVGTAGTPAIVAAFLFTSHQINSMQVTQGQSVFVSVSFSFS